MCACRESLEELNISWCRGVPEPWLGVLADACTCLRKLTVFGCSQVGFSSGVLLPAECVRRLPRSAQIYKTCKSVSKKGGPWVSELCPMHSECMIDVMAIDVLLHIRGTAKHAVVGLCEAHMVVC